ncbi:hypothetical protein BGZ65_003430 [Modicella reniformis]|uniref:CAP-Gly domain-containing protein n=1 Tax=Modicella reniformis TaxID=1440133 RepID=A0A9P6LSY1_9FUNG|nr:hypothetical protein BGZ65_003430 [Modicella reniformis]
MAQPTEAQPQLQLRIGQRIEAEHFRGTIRYVGEVPSTKGVWLGVEWDEKERGKHSGEHNGTKYFDCLFPGTGSFTRPSDKINVGQTLLAVLRERYVDEDKDVKDLFLGQSGIKVDVYDFERVKEKQKNLDQMVTVGLAHTNVATTADFEETQKTCPNITDLDLSSTLVETWKDVADICAPLSSLDVLRLNRNRFHPLTDQLSLDYGFRNLRCLALNRVYLTWDEVELLEPSMPKLKILQIGYNQFTELGKTNKTVPIMSQKVKGFANLKELHLEGNMFTDWNQILRLSHLPKLVSLDLSENKIENILGPQDENDFKALKSLRLNDNCLRDWTSIDHLGRYTGLTTVWLGENHFMDTGLMGQASGGSSHGTDSRIVTIARMPHMKNINGSEVTMKNRLDAELYYTKHVALSTKNMDQEAIRAIHPRFEELCQVHGPPDTSEEYLKATSEILKDRLIAITLVSKDSIDGPVKATFQKKLLGTMTVKSLKNLAQKLMRIPALRQEMVFLTNDPDYENVKVQVWFADDMRQISYYDVKEGEEIIVLDKNRANK